LFIGVLAGLRDGKRGDGGMDMIFCRDDYDWTMHTQDLASARGGVPNNAFADFLIGLVRRTRDKPPGAG